MYKITKEELIDKIKNVQIIPDFIIDYKIDNIGKHIPVIFCNRIVDDKIKSKRKIIFDCPYCEKEHIHDMYDNQTKEGRPVYYFEDCHSNDSPFSYLGYFLVVGKLYYNFMEQRLKQKEIDRLKVLPKNIHELLKIVNLFEYNKNTTIKTKNDFGFIYFIIDKDEVIYIGKTENITKRFMHHHVLRCSTYNAIFYINVPLEYLTGIEKNLINRIKPIWNDKHNRNPRVTRADFGFKY